MSYESLLNTNIYIQTKTSSQNILGEWINTYTSSTTPTKCRMVPIKVSERIDNTGLFDDVNYTCYCLSSASISRDNRVEYAGEYYRVKEMELDSSFHHKKALLKLIT